MAYPYRLPELKTSPNQLVPDLAGADFNALRTQRGRMANQLTANELAAYPEEQNYLRLQRSNALADADYERSRRPAEALEQEAGIFREIFPTLTLESYAQMYPKLQQDLPNLGPQLPPPGTWATEEEFQASKAEFGGQKPTAPKFSAPKEGVDEDGNPVMYRVDGDGKVDIIEGIRPKAGKRMVVRDANGNVIFETGAGPELTSKTKGNIEKKLTDGGEQLTRMLAIYDTWKPEYNEVGTRFAAAWTGTKAFLGAGIEEEDRQLLVDFGKWRRKSIENINLYIKELTGAQMSEKEADRLRLAQPDPGEKWWKGDDPITFKAKMDDVIKTTRAAIARWNYYRNQDISEDKIIAMINDGRAVSLDDIIKGM